jgi:hypothetical protein
VSAPAASVPFDARPLLDPVDRFEVRDFVQRTMQRGGLLSRYEKLSKVVPLVIGAAVFIAFGFVLVPILASILASLAATGDSGGGSFIVGAIGSVLPLVVMAAVLTAAALFMWRRSRARDERWFRLDRFAAANGMSYLPGLQSPVLPGMIFTVGNSRSSSDIIRGDEPRFVEFANYEYTTGSGKNRTTHRWGYVAIKLDVPLPHIVLDATSNNGLFGSNLPASFDRDQRLGLEGDFDEFFSLYCPAGYERDALYLFTPDIMARFIDNAAALDVEIVDDWLFLYGKREFSGLDPATWAWLFSVVAALLDKFAQWARWRDERLQADAAAAALARGGAPGADAAAGAAGAVAAPCAALPFAAPAESLRPPPGVALNGRRLKRGISWPAVIVFGLFVVYWLASRFGALDFLFDR